MCDNEAFTVAAFFFEIRHISGKENGPQRSEGQLAIGEGLEVGKRATICTLTMSASGTLFNAQCHDAALTSVYLGEFV
jgi:hypothetical protein